MAAPLPDRVRTTHEEYPATGGSTAAIREELEALRSHYQARLHRRSEDFSATQELRSVERALATLRVLTARDAAAAAPEQFRVKVVGVRAKGFSMGDPDRRVVDDVEHRRFLLRQDGLDAKLLYRVDGNRLILLHTEVPESLRRRGIAGRLVQAAVERAEAYGETVVPLCTYVRKWLSDHADVDARVIIDWSDPPGVLVGNTR